ncbi:hypothetical protein [Actinomadura sp. CNU-125]|uniref:hypothetical protein n=1 Tax=Actinomadura sp. CNU-125 TaxID=1904961 RepID=UPI0013019631|nr:hypothetical protein [Actinomadura sp. CNU-125]
MARARRRPDTATREDWRVPPPPEHLDPCPEHAVYQGTLGCRLCDPWIQPIPDA